MYMTYNFLLLNRHAAPQNQEGTGCSGEAEGVRRYPPTLWQGDERRLTTECHVFIVWPLHVASTLLSMMSSITLTTLFELKRWKQINIWDMLSYQF